MNYVIRCAKHAVFVTVLVLFSQNMFSAAEAAPRQAINFPTYGQWLEEQRANNIPEELINVREYTQMLRSMVPGDPVEYSVFWEIMRKEFEAGNPMAGGISAYKNYLSGFVPGAVAAPLLPLIAPVQSPVELSPKHLEGVPVEMIPLSNYLANGPLHILPLIALCREYAYEPTCEEVGVPYGEMCVDPLVGKKLWIGLGAKTTWPSVWQEIEDKGVVPVQGQRMLLGGREVKNLRGLVDWQKHKMAHITI